MGAVYTAAESVIGGEARPVTLHRSPHDNNGSWETLGGDFLGSGVWQAWWPIPVASRVLI